MTSPARRRRDEFSHPIPQMILRIVADHDGEFTWYNIMIRAGGPPEWMDPPPPYWLSRLTEAGLLEQEATAEGPARFRLTDRGRANLA